MRQPPASKWAQTKCAQGSVYRPSQASRAGSCPKAPRRSLRMRRPCPCTRGQQRGGSFRPQRARTRQEGGGYPRVTTTPGGQSHPLDPQGASRIPRPGQQQLAGGGEDRGSPSHGTRTAPGLDKDLHLHHHPGSASGTGLEDQRRTQFRGGRQGELLRAWDAGRLARKLDV
jgi:hypothetical protein